MAMFLDMPPRLLVAPPSLLADYFLSTLPPLNFTYLFDNSWHISP